MTYTQTYTITRTHTATHLSNTIHGALAEILTHLGISARSLMDQWHATYDPAIRTWVEEKSLSQVILECHRLDGTVEPILEFPIEYHADGSAGFSHRHEALARQWRKLNSVPIGTTWTIICQFRLIPTNMDGWSDARRSSTDELRSFTLGTLAAGPDASTSIRAYTR